MGTLHKAAALHTSSQEEADGEAPLAQHGPWPGLYFSHPPCAPHERLRKGELLPAQLSPGSTAQLT